jgi:hypothetical protein
LALKACQASGGSTSSRSKVPTGRGGVSARSRRSRALRHFDEQVTASPRTASKVFRQFAQTSFGMSQII